MASNMAMAALERARAARMATEQPEKHKRL